MGKRLPGAKNSFHLDIGDHVIVIALVIFWLLLAITNSAFQKFSIYATIIKEASMYAVCGIGMTYAMIAGEMDMSVASMIAMLSVLFTTIVNKICPSNPTLGILASCAIVLVLGTICGCFNGVLVAKLRIPSFIATLAMQNVYRGIAQWISNSPIPIATMGDEYKVFTTGAGKAVRIGQITDDFCLIYLKGFSFTKILGLPLFFWLMVILAVIGTVILRKTKLGRNVLAIGNSKNAARIAGINISRTQVSIFALLGLFTGVTALMMTSNLGSSNYGVPVGTEFTVISAVVLGGTAPAGGKGSVFNTVVAALFMATISTALTTFGVSNNAYGIFRGCILVFAFSINTIRVLAENARIKHNAQKAAKISGASHAE